MKYGILFFKETENIGDDIQTYVAKKYLPHIDYIIEREHMNTFRPESNEMVNIIMNGWFIHNPLTFPPSPYLNPLIISAHFTDYLRNDVPSYFTEYSLEYFKKHAPIGLRDNLVINYLKKQKIDCYVSGCLTSTIEPFESIKKKNHVLLVDVSVEVETKIKKMFENVVIATNKLDKKTNSKLSFEKRMENVEMLLRKYQESALVITTRLHCALPCLALGVPVILIYDDANQDMKNRLGNYLKYLHHFSESELLSLDEIIPYKYSLKNKKGFLAMKDGLNKKCTEFICNAAKNKKSNIDYEKYLNESIKNMEQIFKNEYNYSRSELIRRENEIRSYYANFIKAREDEIQSYYSNFIKKREKELITEYTKKCNNMELLYRIEKAEKEYHTENLKKRIEALNIDSQRLYGVLNSRYYKISYKIYKFFKKLIFWRKS